MSAEFFTLSDGTTYLELGTSLTSHQLRFELPSGFNPKSAAYVIFMAQPQDDVKFQLKVNEQLVRGEGSIYTMEAEGGTYYTAHEVIQPGILKAGTNHIDFIIIEGGPVGISDVVLHVHI